MCTLCTQAARKHRVACKVKCETCSAAHTFLKITKANAGGPAQIIILTVPLALSTTKPPPAPIIPTHRDQTSGSTAACHRQSAHGQSTDPDRPGAEPLSTRDRPAVGDRSGIDPISIRLDRDRPGIDPQSPDDQASPGCDPASTRGRSEINRGYPDLGSTRRRPALDPLLAVDPGCT